MGEDIVIETEFYWNPCPAPKIKMPNNLPLKLRLRVHNTLYRKMQKLLDRYDPCQRSTDPETSKIQCRIYRDISACCWNKCKYKTNNGCKTECLGCKLHLCLDTENRFEQSNPKVYKRWKIYQSIAWDLRMYRPWHSKYELFQEIRKEERKSIFTKNR